jgi:hypothetical protein
MRSTDIEPSIATKFAIWLAVAMLISGAIVYGTFWLFEGQAVEQGRATQQYPLAVGLTKEPQAPRLQTQPFKDLFQLRQTEREKLTSYGWVDQGAGIVHMPIDDAMRILSERGALPAAAQTPQGLNEVVQDSSAGRTSAPRY